MLKPFLQDIVQFAPWAQLLFVTSLKQPELVIKIIPEVGIENLLDWMRHYFNLGIYTLLYPVGEAMESFPKKMQKQKYYYRR